MGQFLSLLSLPDYLHSQARVTKEQGHLAVYFDNIFKGLSLYMCTRLTDAVTLMYSVSVPSPTPILTSACEYSLNWRRPTGN